MTLFEDEIRDRLQRTAWYGEHVHRDVSMRSVNMPTQPTYDEFLDNEVEAIKQAVDKYVIGQSNYGTYEQNVIARSQDIQRQSLWG